MVQPPAVALKVIVVTHFILTVWASMARYFLPPSFMYMNAFILAVGFWAIINAESSEAAFMFMLLNGISIVMDIIFLGIYNPRAQYIYECKDVTCRWSEVHEYRFCLAMAIINLLLKPLSTFVLYRIFQDRGGDPGGDFNFPGLHNFGVAGANQGASPRGYENIDSQVESAAPHDFKGQPVDSP